MRWTGWVLTGPLVALASGVCHSQEAPVVARSAGAITRLQRSGSLERSGCAVVEGPDGQAQTIVFPAGSDTVSLAAPEGSTLRVGRCGERALGSFDLHPQTEGRELLEGGRRTASVPSQLDWRNRGADSARSGRSGTAGPQSERVLWAGGSGSLVGELPVVEGDRVFLVRLSGFPERSPVIALDLESGEEQWFAELPFEGSDWFAWVAGAHEGVVYASRSGNGNTVEAPLFALDGSTGAILWSSQAEVDADDMDGVVFAPDGDPIVGSLHSLIRIDADDGSTVWTVSRQCCISQGCGAAVVGGTVYIADAGDGGGFCGGGPRLEAYDLENGLMRYMSSGMPGAGSQNVPFADREGGVYYARTSNNPATDKFYAWTDTGSGLEERWNLPAAFVVFSSHAVGSDGSLYILGPGHELLRLDPQDGSVLGAAGGLWSGLAWTPLMAVDRRGSLYYSNGVTGSDEGHLWVFSADLERVWDTAVAGIGRGGPTLASPGLLVLAPATGVIAYQAAEIFADGFETGDTGGW